MDVKTLCLGVLHFGPASGYEIRKQFEDGPMSHIQEAGFGSIYPALRKLSEDGLVKGDTQHQASRPDKTVYTITEAGQLALKRALMTPPADDRFRSDYAFQLLFAHVLPTDMVDHLIERWLIWHRGEITRLETCLAAAQDGNRPQTAGDRFVIGLGIAIYQAAAAFMETHRNDLIAEINLPSTAAKTDVAKMDAAE